MVKTIPFGCFTPLTSTLSPQEGEDITGSCFKTRLFCQAERSARPKLMENSRFFADLRMTMIHGLGFCNGFCLGCKLMADR